MTPEYLLAKSILRHRKPGAALFARASELAKSNLGAYPAKRLREAAARGEEALDEHDLDEAVTAAAEIHDVAAELLRYDLNPCHGRRARPADIALRVLNHDLAKLFTRRKEVAG